jgi:hypothetical protein
MRWIMVGALFLLPLLTGCGVGQGQVKGKVLYDGNPVPGGRVTFRPADPRQNSVSAEVDEQGNYQVTLPVGEVKVCFDNRELEPQASLGAPLPPGLSPEVQKKLGSGGSNSTRDGTGGRPSARYVQVPERYHEIETSNLQFQVKRGEQKQDIEMTK